MLSTLKLSYTFILLTFFLITVKSFDINITIPLNKTTTYIDKQLYGDFVYLNRSSTIIINFSDVSKDLSFIIIQAHSHFYQILMYRNIDTMETHFKGTNVGMNSTAGPIMDTYFIANQYSNIDLKLYIAVHGYNNKDPLPGGCNIEFEVSKAPCLRVTDNKEYTLVDAAIAMRPDDQKCSELKVYYEFYITYLPEMNFNEDVYFDAIKSMMNIRNIKNNGQYIYQTRWITRRKIGTYPGTGAIYTALVHTETNYAMYVPGSSYGCLPLVDGDCDIIVNVLSQFLCAILFFAGLFICYFGHRFFKTEMYLIGFISGFIITYIFISLITLMDRSALILASALSGVFFGAIWLLFWWLYGIPVLSVLLISLDLGFLFSALIYHSIPTFSIFLRTNLNFWGIFILVMLLTAILLVSMTFIANIVCCAVLGGYATVFSIDYFLGSNIKYILINTIRRAIVPDFKRAMLVPPFQERDLMLTLIWILLAITGAAFQYNYSKGRPPFPPPPRSVRRTAPSYGTYRESSPRLEEEPNPSTADERTRLLD